MDYIQTQNFLGLGIFPGAVREDLYFIVNWEETSDNANFHITWQHAPHTISLGGEITRGTIDKESDYGSWPITNWSHPAKDKAETISEETKGIYLNDTIHWRKLTITPGIRYDYHSRADELVNPSFGLAYKLRDVKHRYRGTKRQP